MNALQCKEVMDHLPIIQAVAEGKEVYFAAFDYKGRFIRWNKTNRVLLGPLAMGLYSLKPRYQCIKPGSYKPVPYPIQRESVRDLSART